MRTGAPFLSIHDLKIFRGSAERSLRPRSRRVRAADRSVPTPVRRTSGVLRQIAVSIRELRPRATSGSAPPSLAGNFPRSDLAPAHQHRSRMPFHDRPVFPRGFRCASRNVGLKPTAKDLALFVSDVDAAAAAVFTRNKFPGAPVHPRPRDDQGRHAPRDRRQQQGEQRRHRRASASRTRAAWPPPPPTRLAPSPDRDARQLHRRDRRPTPDRDHRARRARNVRRPRRTIRSSAPRGS